MNTTNELLSLLKRSDALCIVGKGGIGKTRVLESLYRTMEESWRGNVLFIHAPSRVRESYPSFIVNERREIDEMRDEIDALEKVEGIREKVNSSKEILGIINTFLRNGVINKGSVLFIDSLDALMDTSDMRTLLLLLEEMIETKEIKIVISVSTILGVRAVETYLTKVRFIEVKRDDKEKVKIEEKERSEEVYSFFLSMMEDL